MQKIARFYHQLGEDERSLPMADFSEDRALEIIEKYHDVPICVQSEVVEAAKTNLNYLKNFVNKHYC